MDNYDNYKIIFLGSSSVGKSSIILRLIENKFSNAMSVTLGASYLSKKYDDEKINLNIWDTCGQERFKGINTLYYRNSDVIIFVIDSTCKETFQGFESYYEEVKQKGPKNPLIILLFNKIDLINEEFEEELIEIEDYIKEVKEKYKNIKLIKKVSACTGDNVNEVFEEIKDLLKNKEMLINNAAQSMVPSKLTIKKKKKKPSCCK